MSKFQVITGEHVQDGKKFEKGDIVDTPIELDKIFPCKFQKIENAPAVERKPEGVNNGVVKNSPFDLLEKGKDVTGQFLIAKSNGYEVYKKEKKHYVYELDGGEPLSKGLKKDNVAHFIQKLLEENDVD